MAFLKQALTYLSGKKTYTLGIISVVLGVYLQNTELIMTGLIAMGLRAAIK
jgi:hypothetical protein